MSQCAVPSSKKTGKGGLAASAAFDRRHAFVSEMVMTCRETTQPISMDHKWWECNEWRTFKTGITQLQEKGDFCLKAGFEAAGLPVPEDIDPAYAPPWAFERRSAEDEREILWAYDARQTVLVYYWDRHMKQIIAEKKESGTVGDDDSANERLAAQAEEHLKKRGIKMAWRDLRGCLTPTERMIVIEAFHSTRAEMSGIAVADGPDWWESPEWRAYRIGTTQLQEKGDYFIEDGFEQAGLPVPTHLWTPLPMSKSAILDESVEGRQRLEWCSAARHTQTLWNCDNMLKIGEYHSDKVELTKESLDGWAELGARAQTFLKEHGYGMAWRDRDEYKGAQERLEAQVASSSSAASEK